MFESQLLGFTGAESHAFLPIGSLSPAKNPQPNSWGNLEQRYSHAFRCTRQNTGDFETDNYLPSTDAYYNVPHLHQN